MEVFAKEVPTGLRTNLFGYTLTYPDFSFASQKLFGRREATFSQGELLSSFEPHQNMLLSSGYGENVNEDQ